METITSFFNVSELSFSGAELLIRITLLLCVAATAAFLLRKQTPALRRLIWVGAFSLILLIPILSIALPKISLSQAAINQTAFNQETVSGNTPSLNFNAAAETKRETTTVPGPSLANRTTENEPSFSQLIPVQQSGATTVPESVEGGLTTETNPLLDNTDKGFIGSQSQNKNLGMFLLLLWSLGFTLFFLRLLRQTFLASGLLRRSTPLHPNDVLSLFANRIANNKYVSLYCSDELSTPIALGIIKPSIILPMEYQEWSASKQESAILHELGHINHRDSLTRILAYLTCTIYWFHPLAWYGFRKLKEEQEKSADNYVLNKGVTASCYAQNLLDIVKTIQDNQPNSGVMTAMGSYSFFPQRMRSILSSSQSRRSLSRGQTTVTLLILISIAVTLAIFSARPDAQQNDSEERAEVQETIIALEKELVELNEKTSDQDQDSKNEKVADLHSEIEYLKENMPTSPEIEEFQKINQEWSDAFAAADIDKLMGFYTEDAISITPDETYEGKEEIRRYLRDISGSGIEITADTNNVTINGDQAIEQGSYNLIISDSIDLSLSGDYKTQWTKQNGRWLISKDESFMPDLSPIGEYVSGFVSDFIDGFDFDFDFDRGDNNNWSTYDWKNKDWKNDDGQNSDGNNRSWGNRDWSKLEERFSNFSKDISRKVDREMKSSGNRYGRAEDTPLNAAASNGHKDVVKMLLENEINVDKTGAKGNTPLYSAAENGHKAIVKMLLAEGANPNIKNSRGKTPLYSASQNGHGDIVKMLIKSGAKIDNARNN